MLYFLLVFFIPSGIWAQSPCTKGQPSQLATVAVWTKHNDSQTIFRISDEDLTDEGFERSTADRNNFPAQLARDPGTCPVGLCALRLSASRRIKDGAILQAEDVYALPEGYEQLNDYFYCGRALGDCGADVPIYRYTQGRGPMAMPAYSMDSTATIPGFTRDPRPICYGWSDGGAANSGSSTGESCPKFQSQPNGQVTYSVQETSSFAVGTTGSLHCASGFLSNGPTTALCTRNGWNPPIFGDCIRQNSTIVPNSVAVLSSGSSRRGAACTAAATVKNGQIIYSQLEHSGRLPTGTTASILCSLGFVSTSSASLRCENGDWLGQWPSCIAADMVQCQPLPPAPSGAKILYDPTDNPLGLGSTATLECSSGTAASGAVRATCGKTGWQPKTLGNCVTETVRVKRQGLPCLPLAVLGGTVTYVQALPTTLYSAGTSAQILCNIGNILQGAGSVICTNGAWSPIPGTCVPSAIGGVGGLGNGINSGSVGATCADFLPPLGATIAYSLPAAGLSTHPSATVATLTCPLGQTVSGALSSTCSNGIWSPAVLGTCSATGIAGGVVGNGILECANPLVLNGMVTYSQSTVTEPVKPVGTVATAACNLGFTPSGAMSSTCQNGAWTPVLGTCNPVLGAPLVGVGAAPGIECLGGVLPPLGATVTYSNGAALGPYPAGTVATMACTNGAVPTGSTTASCTGGIWTPALLATCPATPLGAPLGGILAVGTTCTAPIPPAGGSFTFSQAAQSLGAYNSGTRATLLCTSGAPAGSTVSTCQNGAWTPLPGSCSGIGGSPRSLRVRKQAVIGTIGGAQCPAGPIVPLGGTATYSNGQFLGPFPGGTVATLQCTAGFVQGSPTSTCSNGIWTPAFGSCSPNSGIGGIGGGGISCPAGPATPVGGSLTYSNGMIFGPYPAGTTATLNCGFQLISGSTTATCSNGIWSQLGTCGGGIGGIGGIGGTSCPAGILTPLGATIQYSNGALFGPFPSGTSATARCTVGVPLGAATSTCSNGIWAPSTLGTCSNNQITDTSCSPLSAQFGTTVTYSPAQAGAFSIPSGTTASLSCSQGSVQGSTTSTCTQGQWYPQIGSCSGSGIGQTGQQCIFAPATPFGGTLSYSNGITTGPWMQGTTVTLNCPFGQYPQGASSATCNNGQWGTLATSCSTNQGGQTGGQQCIFAPATPFGATLSYSNGQTTGPWTQGATVTLNCPFGQYAQGPGSATCNNGQWGTLATSCSASQGGQTGGQQCIFAPATPFGGSLTYSNGQTSGPWTQGTTVTLNCPFGQYPQGASSVTCNNGQWGNLATSCSTSQGGQIGGQQCSFAPATPFGGTLSYSNGITTGPWMQGTTVTLNCPFGQYPQGASSATCNNGQWGTLATSCSATQGGQTGGQQCIFAPATPLGGSLTYSNGQNTGPWQQGTSVTLNCPFGTYPQGTSSATCNNGQWGTLATSCSTNQFTGGTGSGCQPLAPSVGQLTGGVAVYSPVVQQPIPFGTTASLVCNPGYLSTGSQSSVCTQSGWQPASLGICYASGNGQIGGGAQCYTGLTAFMGTVTYSNNQQFGPWPSGTSATLICQSPYILSSGSSSSFCSNGQWSPSQLGTCSQSNQLGFAGNSFGAAGCQTIPYISGGTVTYSSFGGPVYNEGTTATLVCQTGYILSGSQISTVTCRNGGWSPFPSLGSCTQALHSPARFKNLEESGNSTVAEKEESCPPAKAPPFGEITYSSPEDDGLFIPGTTAALRCSDGHSKKGASFSTCRSGMFRPLLGSCDSSSENEDSSPVGVCLPLSSPQNGRVSYIQASTTTALEAGSTALLDCDEGHAVGGRATLSCSADGSWQPEEGLGQCELVNR